MLYLYVVREIIINKKMVKLGEIVIKKYETNEKTENRNGCQSRAANYKNILTITKKK